ncbi:MAG: 2,3-bisphosphoglycerate-independent phosphoglycerate mutase [Patescibacteria group bacterium]
MADTLRPRPVVLIILDGWGVAPPSDGNALARADTPVLDRLIRTYPAMTIMSSSEEVGLSWGEMGNSEVGHLNIGAGRVYYQTLPRIHKSITSGEFLGNPAFLAAANHVRDRKSKLHLLGLLSPGGVHSHRDHLFALLEFCKRQKLKQVVVHAILDGRDTIFNTGKDFVKGLLERMKKEKVGELATLTGRFYAMDRDNRWDRVEKAYNAMVLGVGEMATDPLEAIEASYAKKVYDEEFVPTVITRHGKPVATVEDGDAVIFFNFRPDRSRELARAFTVPSFEKFPRTPRNDLAFITMTEYEQDLPVSVAFPPEVVTTCLAKVLSDAGLKQLHIAETEKYAHVTFFLNGTIEEPFPNEDRLIVPSPRVASYDQAPMMSAQEITKRTVKEIAGGAYDFIVLNFANGDMVGHTGNTEATVKGAEVVDRCVGEIMEATVAKGGVVFITADHGNGEEVLNLQTGEIDKEHSTNPVPFIIAGKQFEGQTLGLPEAVEGDLSLVSPVGMLADVAPTILKVMAIPQPPEMTGRALI